MAKKPHLGIKLEGADNPLDPLARAVTIEDNDRLVDEARLTFADPDGKGAELIGDGKKLTIELGWDDEFAVLFEGVVVERKPEAGAGGMKTLTVVARDLSHKMSEKPVTVLHEEGTLETIVTKIASQNGWKKESRNANITCDPNPKLTELNDRHQVDKTDYQYLQHLADLYGARAFVEYNDGRSQFYFVSNRTLLEADALGRLLRPPARSQRRRSDHRRSQDGGRRSSACCRPGCAGGDRDPGFGPHAHTRAAVRSRPREAGGRVRPDSRAWAPRPGSRGGDDLPPGEGQGRDHGHRTLGGRRLVRLEGDPHLARRPHGRGSEEGRQALLLRDQLHGDEVMRSDA